MDRLLEMILNANSGIRRVDVNTVFNNVANNPVGNEIALDFLINRWNDIQNAYVCYYSMLIQIKLILTECQIDSDLFSFLLGIATCALVKILKLDLTRYQNEEHQ